MLLTHLDSSEIAFLQQIKKELSLETHDEVIKRVSIRVLGEMLLQHSAVGVSVRWSRFAKLVNPISKPL